MTQPEATPARTRVPAWLIALLLGAGWVVFFELARYFAVFLMLGGQFVAGTILLYGLIPLVYFLSGYLVAGAFGAHPYRWLLVAAAITFVAQLVFLTIQLVQFSGAHLTPQAYLIVVVQQLISLPFALLGVWARRRRSK